MTVVTVANLSRADAPNLVESGSLVSVQGSFGSSIHDCKLQRRRVGQGALRPPSSSKNRTCEFPRIRLKPFVRPISRPGCWVVQVDTFHGASALRARSPKLPGR